MIPGKTSCPASFTREYYGYLMSERDHRNHYRSTFECVDVALKGVRGSLGYRHAGWFGHAEAVCNGLPCPPYNNHQEITSGVVHNTYFDIVQMQAQADKPRLHIEQGIVEQLSSSWQWTN